MTTASSPGDALAVLWQLRVPSFHGIHLQYCDSFRSCYSTGYTYSTVTASGPVIPQGTLVAALRQQSTCCTCCCFLFHYNGSCLNVLRSFQIFCYGYDSECTVILYVQNFTCCFLVSSGNLQLTENPGWGCLRKWRHRCWLAGRLYRPRVSGPGYPVRVSRSEPPAKRKLVEIR